MSFSPTKTINLGKPHSFNNNNEHKFDIGNDVPPPIFNNIDNVPEINSDTSNFQTEEQHMIQCNHKHFLKKVLLAKCKSHDQQCLAEQISNKVKVKNNALIAIFVNVPRDELTSIKENPHSDLKHNLSLNPDTPKSNYEKISHVIENHNNENVSKEITNEPNKDITQNDTLVKINQEPTNNDSDNNKEYTRPCPSPITEIKGKDPHKEFLRLSDIIGNKFSSNQHEDVIENALKSTDLENNKHTPAFENYDKEAYESKEKENKDLSLEIFKNNKEHKKPYVSKEKQNKDVASKIPEKSQKIEDFDCINQSNIKEAHKDAIASKETESNEPIESYITFIDLNNKQTTKEFETYTLDHTISFKSDNLIPNRLTNVHSTNTKIMESNIENLKYLCDIQKDILFILEELGNEDKLPEIGRAKLRLTEMSEKFKKEEENLKEINILSNAFKQTLEMPEFGDVQEFDIEEAALSCNTFTDSDGKVTLDQFWNKIKNFSIQRALSEKAVRNLLGSLLHGHAFEVYNDNRENDLAKIMQVLIDRFGEITTISDHVRSLENLTRGPKEKLASVMARCALLLDKTKYLCEAKHRDSRYEIEMKNKLSQVCSEKAKIAIEKERNYALRAGYSLPYANLFNLALDAERDDPENLYVTSY